MRTLGLGLLALGSLLMACAPTLYDYRPGLDKVSHDGDVAPAAAEDCSADSDPFLVRIIETWIYNALPNETVTVAIIKDDCSAETVSTLGPGERFDSTFGSQDVIQVRLADGSLHSAWIFNSTSNFPEAAVVVLPE